MRRGYLYIFGGALLVILILVGLFVLGGRKPVNVQPVALEWWGVFDDTANVGSIINAYQAQHPYVKITYKKFRYEEYEDALIQAWARGSGPDIFGLPNSWVYKFYANGFIAPMPASTRMAFYRVSRPLGIKEEIKVEFQDIPSLTLTDLSERYVQAVPSDAVISGQVYGLPLSIDTLAVFYNRDLFNFATITQPPTTWNEFLDAISRLTLLDTTGGIVQAGAALGTYDNVPRAFDILSVLMMQNGAQMVNEQRRLAFHLPTAGSSETPGVQALQFYTDFAQPTKQAFTWNTLMPDAFEAFVNGQVAMFTGYQYHRDLLQDRAGRVSWSVSSLPQVDPLRPVNNANYWLHAVATRTQHSNEAWNFIQFFARNDVAQEYANVTGRTPALKGLLNDQLQSADPLIRTFAQQALTAKSWYRGKSPVETEDIFDDMISAVLNGTLAPADAATTAALRAQTIY